MFAIIGFAVVFGAILGGYLMEHGKITVLLQPAELVIIGGAAVGTLLIANPLSTVIKILKGLSGILKGSPYTKAAYLDTLKMLYDLFMYARKNGVMKLEEDVENPHKSAVFSKYPRFLANHHAVDFICDTLRMSISGGVPAFDLDQMMEMDMEVHHHESSVPVAALTTVADALPGFGIVAAVLGVVITMGALGGPPEEIGRKVASALVGTFLGILLCYGFFGPLASNLTKLNDAECDYLRCLQKGVIAFAKGSAPVLAVEFARRSIASEVRPSFLELEAACKGTAAAGAKGKAAPGPAKAAAAAAKAPAGAKK
ncbi:MAG TPA: flagellar motor stator protein MotA [Bryobacteraceae bacterium]|nr:flagellar motor stator protein MotA [Bryobacteraceae bacterium]